MGPLIRKEQRASVEGYVERGLSDSGAILAGATGRTSQPGFT